MSSPPVVVVKQTVERKGCGSLIGTLLLLMLLFGLIGRVCGPEEAPPGFDPPAVEE